MYACAFVGACGGSRMSVRWSETDAPLAGYPGHHVYNALLERDLYRTLGHVEHCVYPLYSPQSLLAEGSANYGITMCFPTRTDRVAFEASTLFPLAGLDPATAERYYHVEELVPHRRACVRARGRETEREKEAGAVH